ncbi:MAG TPA: FtsX-like permease family protein [Gemmatimonadaceae bacterium]|nr:FtsX-like permease family protein [Gemmatimonadaceae bacterium]
MSLIPCALGLAGVIAFLVARHTREIGMRVALGATRQAVVRDFMRAAVRPVVIGTLFGLAAALPPRRVC